jgi:WD40 repeat protein
LIHQDPVWTVAFRPDGKTVITGSWDRTARIWDAATGQPLGQPFTHQGSVEAVAFRPDDKTVITGRLDDTAWYWYVAAALPDELGSARLLDSATWLQRREKLKQLGGPPVAGSKR